ncbi:polysaccharide lyase [Gloeocapsopsis dulcis]|uniref:3-keto-disaccharide hydrolase domain-containing protein n=1 Tax=Gloeocapsopsis dulcis AAB1 = 1H9 TaxID=1433147 RepID=A0A6N8G0Z7_9CHRO|nr:polysaccharide lyase [Gloeocapsopsis dulcis]MUL38255.1 hypothetical protein [Gloeocapsopsis dulcis AAB1 = 1H9]WNN89353.1 polysaccharide lyase [Gloeocapsopsis dulcis]
MVIKNSSKSIFTKRLGLSSALGLLLSTTFAFPLSANKSYAAIIDSVTEDINTARAREYANAKGGSTCNQLENVTSLEGNTIHPIRAGKQAFWHWVNRCGERSELAMKKTVIGNTYWYGWSMFIPSTWQNPSDSYDILAQWATYPSPRNGRFPCGSNGSYMMRSGDNISFRFQRKGDQSDSECTSYNLASLPEVRGKWVDFVMQVKWTGNTDGFLKLWTKIGNSSYTQNVDYKGPTFWNDEGEGPYFKMGLYKGDPNFNGAAPRVLYTDEYRLGDANSSFEEVAPGGSSPEPDGSQPLISESFSSSSSNFTVESGGAWSVLNGKYELQDSDRSVPQVANRNISIHNKSVSGNFTLTADASATATSSRWDDFSIIFNYQDRNNYYYASFNESDDDKTHGIFKVVAGVATQIANFDSFITGGTTYNIKVERTGNTIGLYRNGSLQATVQDITFNSGKVGFGSFNNSATFDNLKVE